MTPDEKAADPLLNSAEAAAYLNVPLSTLRNQRRIWGLHPFRIGRALMWRESELAAWLESRREQIPA
jgi:Helix-turn-helix domain